MKGIFLVVAPTPPVATSTATTTTSPTLPGFFNLSQSTVPSGMVTLVITNKCNDQCSFDLEGIKAGAILNPGQSDTWTVALAPGIYQFHCDVLPAMRGRLFVTT